MAFLTRRASIQTVRRRAFVATIVVLSATACEIASADDGAMPGAPTLGLRMSVLAPVKNDATGPLQTRSQSSHLASDLYVEWQLSRVFGVGLALRYALDLYSTVDDVALAARIRFGFPVRDWLYPYLVAALGPGQWHTEGVSLAGLSLSTGVGASLRIASPVWIVLEVGYEYTSFAGEAPLDDTVGGAPVVHADVRTSFVGVGAGVELRF